MQAKAKWMKTDRAWLLSGPAPGEARAEFAHALAKALEAESGLDVAAVKEFVPATIQAIQENVTCYVARSSWRDEIPIFCVKWRACASC